MEGELESQTGGGDHVQQGQRWWGGPWRLKIVLEGSGREELGNPTAWRDN